MFSFKFGGNHRGGGDVQREPDMATALQQARRPKASERTRYERLLTVMDDLDQRGRLQQLLGRSPLPVASSISSVLSATGKDTRPSSTSGMRIQITWIKIIDTMLCHGYYY